jgi:hypothetical protein
LTLGKLKCIRSPYNCRQDNYETPANGKKKDDNRKYNDADKSYYWGLVGHPSIKDGRGGVRGHAQSGTRINFGQRKTIAGESHVYAFAIRLVEGFHAGGWVSGRVGRTAQKRPRQDAYHLARQT